MPTMEMLTSIVSTVPALKYLYVLPVALAIFAIEDNHSDMYVREPLKMSHSSQMTWR
jgi:hypothetical protein